MAVDTQRNTEATKAFKGDATLTDGSSTSRTSRRRRGASIREAPRATDDESSNTKKPPQETDGSVLDGNAADETAQWRRTASNFIETLEVQAVVILLITLDILATALSLHLHTQQEIRTLQQSLAAATAASTSKTHPGLNVQSTMQGAPPLLVSVTLRVLDSFTGFTIVLFLVELVVLLVAFHRRFFSHIGYMIDVAVVCTSIFIEIYTASKAVRLLGLLRVWRVVRLVGSLLDRERKEHELTLDALDMEKTRVIQLQYEKRAAEDSLKREYDSRAGMERMLQGYKDESDTLREALHIAAQAVAEASIQQTEMDHEDELVEPPVQHADPYTTAAASEQQYDIAQGDPAPFEQQQAEHWEGMIPSEHMSHNLRAAEDAAVGGEEHGQEDETQEFTDALDK